jgi:hypothetical protein
MLSKRHPVPKVTANHSKTLANFFWGVASSNKIGQTFSKAPIAIALPNFLGEET